MNSKRVKIIVTIVAILLSIPLIAMQFTDEVSWSLFDFLVMGVLLLGVGFFIELVMMKVTPTGHRIALIAVILLAFLVAWAELAVGILGTPFAGS